MTIIHARRIGDEALLTKDDLLHLVELARRTETVELQFAEGEVSTADMMRLAEASGSFDFWIEPGEDLYSIDDGEPV